MDNLNNALKRIKKKKEVKEAAPLAAIGKGVAAVGKAVAKGGAKAAKGAAKASKPVAKNLRFKRPNIRSYKNPETGKVDMDRYRSDQAKYKKIQQDKKNRPDMSNVKPDGVDSKRTERGERKLKAIDKVTDKKKENIKKGLQTTGDVANKAGEVANYARKKAKSAVSATTSSFGTSSFNKEDYNYVEEYLKNL
jgi:hypothetical protein